MKKCHGCERELDKYMIVCEYCGVLTEGKGHSGHNGRGGPERSAKRASVTIARKTKKG